MHNIKTGMQLGYNQWLVQT